MERHIGLWEKENSDKPAVAELIIDGNHIEFYQRDCSEVFPCAFVGSDNDYRYKVFTSGSGNYGKHKTLERVTSYRVFYVLRQNCGFKSGLEIDDINTVSLAIPELIEWIDLKAIDWRATENGGLIATETKLQSMILKDRDPRVEIYFESKSSLFDTSADSRTTFTINNQPRIRIAYGEPTNIRQVHSDIRVLMQFFALMIGYVTDALDIRLDLQGQNLKSSLYINEDFSYNLRTLGIIDKPRTKLQKVQENLQTYFETWYTFYKDDKYELVRRMYFMGNTKKEIFAEDILVQYVRILEGYHLRVTEDERIVSELKEEIRKYAKNIKRLIFTDEGKALFQPIFDKANWKYNSDHANDVASWIASGFLERTSLEKRLKDLDDSFFNIIAMNAEKIERISGKVNEDKESGTVIANYYKKIVSTRNYYSHYKVNRDNVLEFQQMYDTINVLKALIIMILYYHMGMPKNEIRKIIIWDSELHFQTKCLRQEGELADQI